MEKQFQTTIYGTVTEVKVEGDYNVVLTNVLGSFITIDMSNHQQLQLFIGEFFKHIQDLPKQVQVIIEQLMPKLPKKLTNIPDNLTDYFIGRDTDIDKIHQLLMIDGRAVLVNGMGGIGKSALAQEYIRLKKECYKHIAYVKVLSEFERKTTDKTNNEDALFDAFAHHPNLSKNLGLEFDEKTSAKIQFAQILNKLNEIEGINLLIIDNASEVIAQYREYLPNKDHWKILLTSRQQIVHLQPYFLGVLGLEDAKSLFYNYYIVEKDDINLERILAYIGYHTLSIELLAKQAQERYISITTLIDMLDKKGINIPKRAKVAPLNSHKTQTTIKHLLETFIIDLDKESIRFLLYFSILPSISISYKDLLDYFEILPETDNFFFNILTKLKRNGWINQSKATYICHQIIQEVVRKKSKPSVNKCSKLIISIKNKISIDIRAGEHGVFKKQYIPLAESILKHINQEHIYIAFLAHKLGYAIMYNGNYTKSMNYFDKALDVYKKSLPEKNIDLADLYNAIGVTLRHNQKYSESLKYLLLSANIKEYLIDNGSNYESVPIAQTYHNIGIAHRYIGNYSESIHFFLKSISTYQKLNDESKHDMGLAAALTHLGSAYRLIEEYEKSILYHLQSLKIYEKKVGLNHPDVLTPYNNLSLTYERTGDWAKKLEYTQKAVQIGELHYEATHPYLIIAYKNLSKSYFQVNQFEKAKFYMDKVVEVRRNTLPSDHENLIDVLEWQVKINLKLKACDSF